MSVAGRTNDGLPLQKYAQCSICQMKWKNAFLRTCGHLFCRDCLEDRISNRLRKCPACGKAFDKSDIMVAHM